MSGVNSASETTPPDCSVSSSSKVSRKQGVSCDACKFRKVKCDRKTKVENRQAHESEENIACSVCSSHGLRCTYTQSAPKRRRGKRIVAIQRGQLDEIDESLAIRSLAESDLTAPLDPREALFGKDFAQFGGEYILSPYNLQKLAKPVNVTTPPEGLLDVRGLTRALLDACVKSYFKYAGPCMPILHAEIFAARYALFFAAYEKNNGITPFWKGSTDNAYSNDRPLSELLLLAVGCIGASLLEPPIAEFGSTSKFRLQDRLALKFQERLNKDDLLLRMQHEGTDVVEACYVMSDPFLTVLGDDLPSRSAIDWTSIGQLDRSQRDPLRLRPASHEGIVRLVYKMGINQRPKLRKDCPPGDNRIWETQGVFVTEREAFRRLRIFWSTFIQDSFRSMGERRSVLIGNDDYDLDLPRFLPRPDGSFTALLFDNSFREKNRDLPRDQAMAAENGPPGASSLKSIDAATIYLQPARFARFDAIQFQVMLRLAFIIRTVSIKFVSPRSQGRGVLDSDVERAINALSAWYQQLPSVVTWEVQSEPLQEALHQGKTSSSNALAMRNSLKALFVETLYHANVLAIWASVDSFGIRSDDIDLAETIALFSSRMRVNENVNPSLSNNTSNKYTTTASQSSAAPLPTPKTSEEIRKITRQRLDHLAAKSFLRISKVAREAGRLGLVRANRLVYVNIFSSYSVWGCGLARKLAGNSTSVDDDGDHKGEVMSSLLTDIPPGYNQIDYIFKGVENLLYSLGTIDSCEGIEKRVASFKELLQKSRESCSDIRQDQIGSKRSQSNTSNSSPAGVGEDKQQNDNDKEKEESSSPADEPFRYYFRTRGERGFGDTTKGLGRQGPQRDLRGEPMDTDEVAMMAYAAVPFQPGFKLDDADSPSSEYKFKEETTPESQKGMSDAALDLDLESITGMDTTWLHQYLQNNDGQTQGHMPTQAPSSASPATSNSNNNFNGNGSGDGDFLGPYYVSSQFNPFVGTGMTPAGIHNPTDTNPFANNSSSINTSFPSSNTPAAAKNGIDEQWDQFMANSDAQIWADAQWQGFNVDTTMF